MSYWQYNITTVCYIKKTKNILNGKIGYIVVPQERSIDIDTITDLKVASILKRK